MFDSAIGAIQGQVDAGKAYFRQNEDSYLLSGRVGISFVACFVTYSACSSLLSTSEKVKVLFHELKKRGIRQLVGNFGHFAPRFTDVFKGIQSLTMIRLVYTLAPTKTVLYYADVHKIPGYQQCSNLLMSAEILMYLDVPRFLDKMPILKEMKALALAIDRGVAKIFAVSFHCLAFSVLFHRGPEIVPMVFSGIAGFNEDKTNISISDFTKASFKERIFWVVRASTPEGPIAQVCVANLKTLNFSAIPGDLKHAFFG